MGFYILCKTSMVMLDKYYFSNLKYFLSMSQYFFKVLVILMFSVSEISDEDICSGRKDQILFCYKSFWLKKKRSDKHLEQEIFQHE